MGLADYLFSAIIGAAGHGAKQATLAEEYGLGHSGHAVAKGTDAKTVALGTLGDAFQVALTAACTNFFAALDVRYHHGTPPHPAGLPAALFGDRIFTTISQSVAASLVEVETGRGHTDAAHVNGIIAAAIGGVVTALAGDAQYQSDLTNLAAACDARYVSGTTEQPVGNAADGLKAALTLCAQHVALGMVRVTELANGHYGHEPTIATAAQVAAVGAVPIDAIAAEIMAALDLRYKDIGEE